MVGSVCEGRRASGSVEGYRGGGGGSVVGCMVSPSSESKQHAVRIICIPRVASSDLECGRPGTIRGRKRHARRREPRRLAAIYARSDVSHSLAYIFTIYSLLCLILFIYSSLYSTCLSRLHTTYSRDLRTW